MAEGASQGEITAIVLAGGRGARMGGIDKGLALLGGIPLAQHTCTRIAQQAAIACVLISANRNLNVYASWGYPVLPDAGAYGDFAGPLGGFLTGLVHCTTPYLLTLPCDTPRFPDDLAQQMFSRLSQGDHDIAIAQQSGRAEPAFCLLRVNAAHGRHAQPQLASLRASLMQFLQAGGRKVEAWTNRHKTVCVDFDAPRHQGAFANVNTLAQLAALAATAS